MEEKEGARAAVSESSVGVRDKLLISKTRVVVEFTLIYAALGRCGACCTRTIAATTTTVVVLSIVL